MSRGIAVHVVAGILLVGVGTPHAQESMPRPTVVEARNTLPSIDCVDGIEGDVGVTVAIPPHIHLDDPADTIEGQQNADGSPRAASDSPQAKAKAGTARRWFSGAMLRTLEFLAGAVVSTDGR